MPSTASSRQHQICRFRAKPTLSSSGALPLAGDEAGHVDERAVRRPLAERCRLDPFSWSHASSRRSRLIDADEDVGALPSVDVAAVGVRRRQITALGDQVGVRAQRRRTPHEADRVADRAEHGARLGGVDAQPPLLPTGLIARDAAVRPRRRCWPRRRGCSCCRGSSGRCRRCCSLATQAPPWSSQVCRRCPVRGAAQQRRRCMCAPCRRRPPGSRPSPSFLVLRRRGRPRRTRLERSRAVRTR